MARIACIVEGHGEIEAVPALIRRIARDLDPAFNIEIPRPIRIPRHTLLKERELERAVLLAAMNAGNGGGILLVIDADDDCPAQLGPILAGRVSSTRADLLSVVVLANREFETWFLAAAPSILGPEVESPPDPERIRGAKEWLRKHRGAYSPPVDQARLTYSMDFDQARRSGSFDRCYNKILGMLEVLRG